MDDHTVFITVDAMEAFIEDVAANHEVATESLRAPIFSHESGTLDCSRCEYRSICMNERTEPGVKEVSE